MLSSNNHIYLIFSVFAQFGEAYGLLFIMDLLWTASTMAVVLVSLQMELVECNFVCNEFDYHDFIIFIQLDSTRNRSAGHFKGYFGNIRHISRVFGALFGLRRAKRTI